MTYNLQNKRIWIAGHNGMVGSALCRRLAKQSCEIITANRKQLDLTRQYEVEQWMQQHKPDAIILAAAKVGGILANKTFPADFIYDNLMIESNIIHAAKKNQVEKLLFLGSSCIYPKITSQPIKETALLTGALEPTNECYAIAKIAGIKLCQAYRQQHGCDFIAAMPTNLYGPNDNFDLKTSHVLPALIAKTHQAKINNQQQIVLCGSGTPRREFLHVDDLADALVFLLQHYSDNEVINIGVGEDLTIHELATHIAAIINYSGNITYDSQYPDGTPQKLLNITKLKKLGWQANISLTDGIKQTYQWYCQHNTSQEALT